MSASISASGSAVIATLKGAVGSQSAERRATLSETEMRDFATCIHATVGATFHSPISSAPIPTLFTIFRAGEFELVNRYGVELKQILHAEQEYEIFQTLFPGEEISYLTTLSSVNEKKGKGAVLAFLAFETDFVRTGDAVKVASARSTMVYRELA